MGGTSHDTAARLSRTTLGHATSECASRLHLLGEFPDRRSIRISWERSLAAEVDRDRARPAYSELDDRSTVLTRAARPVLAQLAEELSNEPVTLILTDAKGLVLLRAGGDPSLRSALDAVDLAPGFSYAEEQVGTNGIGTALEVGEAIMIDGGEHFAGSLRGFSCAGALITHPVTGGLLGVVDITTQAEHSNSLLLSFAKLAASRIRERMLDDASALDKALLGDYHLTCRRSGGAVIALGDEVFIMNAHMQRHFDANDQAVIIDQSQDARGRSVPYTSLAELPSGLTARLSYHPTFLNDALAGGVLQIKEHRAKPTSAPRRAVVSLPGVAGASATWLHAVDEVVEACDRREWVIVEGEVAVGKQLLLSAAHLRAGTGRPLHTVDAAADAEQPAIESILAVLDQGADLLVRHAHLLVRDDLDRLAEALQSMHDASDDGPWVAMTVLETEVPSDDWGIHLLGFFPRTVRVPPLRHHIGDIPVLTRHLLDLAGAPDLTLSSQALNQLMRLSWNGNVGHLKWVLTAVSRRRRSGEAGTEDLPPECRTTTRRQLTPIEAMERDAIVEALALHDGDKVAAATALGMSRATIYRKVRSFGISS